MAFIFKCATYDVRFMTVNQFFLCGHILVQGKTRQNPACPECACKLTVPHTDGDVFVFLPKEKVLVTGVALYGWTPYMADRYPYDWIKTLDVAEKLDFDYVIPVTAMSCGANTRNSHEVWVPT